MLSRKRIRTFWLLVPLAIVSLLLLASCGDDNETTPGATATTEQTPGGETPEAIDISGVPELEDGTLTIGSDIAYAPIEFYIEGTETPDGLDVDLANALAGHLGVDVEFINTGFDGIISALNTEEFDIIMSAMTINEERSQQVDFVPYLNVGHGILVPTGNPNNIQALEDLCGLTVAVQLGTVQETFLREKNADCAEPIDIVTFDTNPLAVEDLRTGGSDANFSDFPVALLDAQESDGELEIVEPSIDPSPYGIAVRKSSTALGGVLEQALQAVVSSGEYAQILEDWGLSSAALPRD